MQRVNWGARTCADGLGPCPSSAAKLLTRCKPSVTISALESHVLESCLFAPWLQGHLGVWEGSTKNRERLEGVPNPYHREIGWIN